MKTIGLIGGMSWESTVPYYQLINESVKRELGGLHSAKIVLWSVEFDEIERCQSEGRWDDAGAILAKAAAGLEAAGADFILICTNTMHKVYRQVEAAVNVPLIHIADATAAVLKAHGVGKVGLLGTRYTMQQDFYKGRLAEQGFEVRVPGEAFIGELNRIIFEELCVGIIREESRQYFARAIEDLKAQGCEGVILGCTEIGLLVHEEDSCLPFFDTTVIHAEAAAKCALL
ncbi:MAG: aspartate/glutamate racemase family protein [Clostridia bacterium]|nr:aspartate/glutamate racemase family protein [Clostridia bacterium]